METETPSETRTKDQIRAVQRLEIFNDLIKDPSARGLIQVLIPSDRYITSPGYIPSRQQDTLKALLRTLGPRTHTVLFGLAATAKNPTELYNIFANLENMWLSVRMNGQQSDHRIFAESENAFFTRPLPESILASQQVKDKAKDILMGDGLSYDNPKYFLETYFYILSTNTPPDIKRSLYHQLHYSFQRAAAVPPELRQKFYNSDVSFWNNVDGSWIYPDLQPTPTTPKSPVAEPTPKLGETPTIIDASQFQRQDQEEKRSNEPRKINPLSDLLGRKKISILSDENIRLKQSLKDYAASASQFTENAGRLQQQLDERTIVIHRLTQLTNSQQQQLQIAQRENQQLKIRLREAERQRQQAQTRRPPEGQVKKSPFEVLGVSQTATSDEITKAYRKIMLALHPDQVGGKLENSQLSVNAITEIKSLLNGRMQEVNAAMEQLRIMRKVK